MKNIFYYLASLIVILFVSCGKVEEPERSSITSVDQFKVVSAEASSTSVLEETPETVTVSFTIDENLKLDGVANISVNPASTATADVDFHLNESSVTLHPWQTDYSFTFDVFSDIILEGDETVIFDISTSAEPFFADAEGQSVTVNIVDFVTDDLYLTFDWDVQFEFGGDLYTTCPFVDIDVYVLDEEGNDLGIYDAATGACPEGMIINSDWEDGTYYLASNMWDNGVLQGLDINTTYTMTVSGYRQAKIDFSDFVVADNWFSDDLDQANDGNADFKEVGILEIAGNVYTVSKPDGTVVGSGFRAPHKASSN